MPFVSFSLQESSLYEVNISYCSYACLFLMYNFTVRLELKITMSELIHVDKYKFNLMSEKSCPLFICVNVNSRTQPILFWEFKNNQFLIKFCQFIANYFSPSFFQICSKCEQKGLELKFFVFVFCIG